MALGIFIAAAAAAFLLYCCCAAPTSRDRETDNLQQLKYLNEFQKKHPAAPGGTNRETD